MRRFLWSALLLLVARIASAGVADITVDVGTNTVTPEKPFARVTEDGFLLVQILNKGDRPDEKKTRLIFAQEVLEYDRSTEAITDITTASKADEDAGKRGGVRVDAMAIKQRSPADSARAKKTVFALDGTAHHLRVLPCRGKHLNLYWPAKKRKVTKEDCPLIVSNNFGSVTIIADDDSVPLVAEVTTSDNGTADDLSDDVVLRAPVSIRTVRPNYGLTFSTGPVFFVGDQLRDEQYRLKSLDKDTTHNEIFKAGTGEPAYEIGIFANYLFQRYAYLRPFPLGITFGFSAKVPVEQLTVAAGLSHQLKPFPVTDSAFITAGVAYRAHDRLLPKYRADLRAPIAITEDELVGKQHDVGLFLAIHFAFAGGGRDQFKKVVSGGQ